jgi:hypothetical protein
MMIVRFLNIRKTRREWGMEIKSMKDKQIEKIE